jgi:4a-hydroxytetrahydrobiopterin dehydratase
MALASKHCVPCEGGTPPLSATEATALGLQVPQWTRVGDRIHRTFSCADFVAAMVFVNAVAALAEAEGHHPDIHIHYNKVRLKLWTHAIGGLSENDFILAAKIDGLTVAEGTA